MVGLELLLVLVLILVNGFLAMAELAVVSARRGRLNAMVIAGQRGAAAALALGAEPGRFLSTVQIGITLVGVLAGAFSGATLAERLGGVLADQGLTEPVADTVAFAIVVAIITYLSLIVGELVPKQVALRNPERIAAAVAGTMRAIARVASPLVLLLDVSARLVLRLLGGRAGDDRLVTDEEIKALIAEAESAGVVEPEEKRMIAGVMRLGDRPVAAIMTPRHEVDWIDLAADDAEIRAAVRRSRHARLPAASGSLDEVSGIVETKDLLDAYLEGRTPDPRALVKRAPVVHDGVDALEAIETLRQSDIHVALIVDEYGSFQGLVTRSDVLRTIAGEFRTQGESEVAALTERDDGSWLIDGATPIDEAAETLRFPLPAGRTYHTVAGFALSHLRHLPRVGERFIHAGWRFEVVDLDGRRIDKLLVSRLPGRLGGGE